MVEVNSVCPIYSTGVCMFYSSSCSTMKLSGLGPVTRAARHVLVISKRLRGQGQGEDSDNGVMSLLGFPEIPRGDPEVSLLGFLHK